LFVSLAQIGLVQQRPCLFGCTTRVLLLHPKKVTEPRSKLKVVDFLRSENDSFLFETEGVTINYLNYQFRKLFVSLDALGGPCMEMAGAFPANTAIYEAQVYANIIQG
jgi:hypothetical protein